jgi:hypothetical protein
LWHCAMKKTKLYVAVNRICDNGISINNRR